MDLNEDFVKQLQLPILQVWSAISPDLGGDDLPNKVAIECCLDADRLTTFGWPKSHEVLKEAFSQHSYGRVVDCLSEHIYLV